MAIVNFSLSTVFLRWQCFRTFVARNCLLTLSSSQGRDAHSKLKSPKRVPAVYWFCMTLLYPWVMHNSAFYTPLHLFTLYFLLSLAEREII